MKFIRESVLSGELLTGMWCNIASSISVEIAGRSGFDWLLIDLEHGVGDLSHLVPQLQALGGSPSAPIVRIGWNDPTRFKRVLDIGALGVMVPYVSNPEEAQAAARSMLYPPQGIRGIATLTRANAYGNDLEEYLQKANDGLLTVVQIETPEAVDTIDGIAAVDHVDVLFVGPMDLSSNLGIQRQYDHPTFRDAIKKVIAAAKNHGKAAGTLLASPAQIDGAIEDGYTFVALSSDAAILAKGMRETAAVLNAKK